MTPDPGLVLLDCSVQGWKLSAQKERPRTGNEAGLVLSETQRASGSFHPTWDLVVSCGLSGSCIFLSSSLKGMDSLLRILLSVLFCALGRLYPCAYQFTFGPQAMPGVLPFSGICPAGWCPNPLLSCCVWAVPWRKKGPQLMVVPLTDSGSLGRPLAALLTQKIQVC